MQNSLKKSFSKSIIILASGSIIAQVITVIVSPFLTRLFSPDEIGTYTYILSIATTFMAVMNGRYDMAIVTEEKEEHVYPLIKAALLIGVFISIIITFGYFIYITYISKKYTQYGYTVVIMFLLLLSYAINNVLISYNNRNKEYKTMTTVYVIKTTIQNVGAVVMGLLKSGLVGLLLPYVIGQYMGMKKQATSMAPNFGKIKSVKGNEVKEVIKRHYKQPLFSAPAIFVNSFSYSSITLFIESLFGMAIVGYYSISVRLLGLPLSLVSGNISKVFFEEASREFNETKQFYKSFKKTVKFLIALAIPMVVGMMLFAPAVCRIVFGSEWQVAGEYVVILAPMFGFRFIVSAISPGMIIAQKQNIEFILQMFFVIISVFCFAIVKFMNLSIEFYLVSISALFTVGYIVYFIAVLKYSKKR